MGFGVLDIQSGRTAPGTVLLEDLHQGQGSADIILVPEPSTSPQDPLNFSRLRKELYFLALLVGACAAGVMGPVLVPGFGVIVAVFNVTLTDVALLNGSLIMALGVSSYICAPLAEICGRRLVYLSTTVLLLVGCVWAAASKSYGSLMAARVFQGLGMGCFFSVAGTTSINDVFFVHERGFRVGLWNFAVISSVNIAPIISGYVIVDLGWRWSFWLLAITFGLSLALVIFFLPETMYERNIEGVQSDTDKLEPKNSPAWKRILGVEMVNFKGIKALITMTLAPLVMLRHPAVLWGCAVWSVLFTWNIIQGAIADQIFSAPPFNLSTSDVGLMVGIAPFIGSTLGTIGGGWICDFVATGLSKRNAGLYEPEFRLVVMVPSLITVIIGAFGLGLAVEQGLSQIKCAVFLAILNFGTGIGCTGVVVYTNDVCRERAGEAFGLAMLVKSAFAFGLTFMLNKYLAVHGPMVFFSTWGGLTVGVLLTTIPLYVFGKRLRAFSKFSTILA
ncbi:major facilitator superfamily domain-containing protein [Dactylonectria macrodidyma]|uniref:Major facilitator superfamily domain-containing protein n=1 Tax=Dactylonectria macrodidyma TaxID=307937 RepID=A0A9P9J3U0_9HYPO|nr:major facilitator superfamily domain-containing protein [Dactylonectria macrodidyma]